MPHGRAEADKPDLAAVLAYYGHDRYGSTFSLPSALGWRNVRCPFHEDAHPSGRVNLEIGGYWCPVCGMQGDSIKLIREVEGLGFLDAIEWANRTIGKSSKRVSSSTTRRRQPYRPSWRK